MCFIYALMNFIINQLTFSFFSDTTPCESNELGGNHLLSPSLTEFRFREMHAASPGGPSGRRAHPPPMQFWELCWIRERWDMFPTVQNDAKMNFPGSKAKQAQKWLQLSQSFCDATCHRPDGPRSPGLLLIHQLQGSQELLAQLSPENLSVHLTQTITHEAQNPVSQGLPSTNAWGSQQAARRLRPGHRKMCGSSHLAYI